MVRGTDVSWYNMRECVYVFYVCDCVMGKWGVVGTSCIINIYFEHNKSIEN